MALSIYSTLSRTQAPFAPIEPNHVRMYVCGVTVYDYCHIGHGRTFVAFDVVRRWLEASGMKVTFVRNITDVDDKIIRRAAERGITTTELTEEFGRAMQEDMLALGCLAPTHEPRATDYIPEMLGLIEKLEQKGYAYQGSDGDVDFAVRKFENYGRLSGKSIDDLQSGARVDVAAGKRDPLDFVLWKSAKPGEPQWESKWGCGRPGWHIECSAMSAKILGDTFDIHGGGPDLIFPHHENEIAQSEAASGVPFAKVWMHSGPLRVRDASGHEEKMSKSLGNFFTLAEVLEQHSAAALRLLMLQTSYRSPLDFSWERLEGAENSLTRIAGTVENLRWAANHATADADEAASEAFAAKAAETRATFKECMDDDFNTAGAMGAVFGFVTECNQYLEQAGDAADKAAALAAADTLVELLDTFGVELPEPKVELPLGLLGVAAGLVAYTGDDVDEAAAKILEARAEARAAKNWDLADAIRDQLKDLGLTIEDTAAGTRIKTL